ncbi:MAG TPA: hypothetical protein VM347_25050 [Nonomuraea sp.]|nr:hypothetical protein [Nonomuraea sp.]
MAHLHVDGDALSVEICVHLPHRRPRGWSCRARAPYGTTPTLNPQLGGLLLARSQ